MENLEERLPAYQAKGSTRDFLGSGLDLTAYLGDKALPGEVSDEMRPMYLGLAIQAYRTLAKMEADKGEGYDILKDELRTLADYLLKESGYFKLEGENEK